MKITQIVVTAGRVIPHPYEQFANLRPSLTLTATLEDGEDALSATRALQAQAETLIEDHKEHLISSLERLSELREREREMVKLESLITSSQQRLTSLRAEPLDMPTLPFRRPEKSEEDEDQPF